MGKFNTILLNWYRDNKRELPWRDLRDPYAIWISEIILQQTRVVQGYDYFLRFMNRFPNLAALAEASEDEVMRHWQGLGYYSRARNLHAAARSLNGVFPKTYTEVRAMKGVGDYTAAAICSFAYGMPIAVVDGNVYRVLARYYGIDEAIDTTLGKKMFAALAQENMDVKHPADYNQAIMDFGALQCVPKSPNCTECPLAEQCSAYRQDMVSVLPVKQHKTAVKNRYFNYFYVAEGDNIFIRKRQSADIWKNLYELPMIETDSARGLEELMASKEFADLFADAKVCEMSVRRLGVKHVLTHRVIWANCYQVRLEQGGSLPHSFIKVPLNGLSDYAFPRLIISFLEK